MKNRPENNPSPASETHNIVGLPKSSLQLRYLATLVLSVLVAEAIAAALSLILAPLPRHLDVLLHVLTTVAVVLPSLYFFSFRPMLALIAQREQAERALDQARHELERDLQERTAELVAANLALEAEQRRLFSLLNELPAIVYLKAPDYSIRFANRQFQARFGDPAAGPCYQLIHGRDTPCDLCATVSVLENREPREWETTYPDGKCYQLYDYPFVDVDGTQLVLQLGIDITERKRAEARLERTNRELLALSQAERKERLFAEGLVQAVAALNSSLDLAEVLDRILEQTQRVIPCYVAAVMLLEGDQIYLARHRGIDGLPETLEFLRSGVPLSAFPVLQTTCLERRAVLLPDVERAPGWREISGLGWVRSFASVPIMEGESVAGLIALFSEKPGFFTSESTHRLQVFAAHAVLAIQNARLFEQMRAGREQLLSLSRRLVEVQENERRHVARELHDEASQALTSLVVQLKLMERLADDRQAVLEGTSSLIHNVQAVMENLHRLAMDLRPASLDHLGLEAALSQHCEAIRDKHDMVVEFEPLGLDGRLLVEVETALYRIIQEALSNAIRHAQATRLDIVLERRDGKLLAIVEDNGQGFDPATVVQQDRLGLLGMRERAETLGGTLDIESAPGGGTTVFVEVPYAD
jgi:signal transduction histidine kinase